MIATENSGKDFDQIMAKKKKKKKKEKEKKKEMEMEEREDDEEEEEKEEGVEYTTVDGAVNGRGDVGESSSTMRKCFYPTYINIHRDYSDVLPY